MDSIIKKIAVLTSGGDAPGMNAAIRAVVRTAKFNSINVTGVKRGYRGLVDGDFINLEIRDVGNIIQRGGTMLLTARSEEFKTEVGLQKAIQNLKDNHIEALIVIGGDGTMRGAYEIEKKGIPVIGIPATIDNDIFGTDQCIGVDTSLNTITDAVDKLRDTALSHERIFVVEVMGNRSGYLACESAISVGAESVIAPEFEWSIENVINRIERGYTQGKKSHIIIVSEGAASARDIADSIIEKTGMEVRITVLGHIQRGGTPTVVDRNLGTKFGFESINSLLERNTGVMLGIIKGRLEYISLKQVKTEAKISDRMHYAVQNILSI
jgi:6-phosphofructokinase 1